ncbi:ABC transporter substrate-binding protein [Roseovarius sp. SCSIO 43702]|uniref:ABC transporter substrate-binding protein n=1 Tax=Roseovarius sp. SCSIO 43702 TaxID=2823043 RepID=UPI002175A947|nr:ABC transporter substrate-binding protein [Roseovarius sp. SCSIO 43702]
MRPSDIITQVAALILAIGAAQAAQSDAPPERVVSMNLCTDQLAMMLAGEGQLLSVSDIAHDPLVSPMVEEARAYRVNHGLAEEIYLMRPDLVLAGQYTNAATVDMLRRLGVRVEIFKTAQALDEVPERIRQMGAALGREDAAETLIADFEARLALLRATEGPRPEAVLYYANGYTLGGQTLAGDVLEAAGFENAAVRAGYASGARMPLEVLATLQPDIVITSRKYPGASRSEDILNHPVVQRMREDTGAAAMTDGDWVCGTPFVLRAIEELAEVRRALLRETGERE